MPETLAPLPGVNPDGLALDAEGGLLISCFYPYRLLRLPLGARRAELLLDDPTGIHLLMPTNVAFFGEGLGEIAIAALGGYSISGIRAPVPGASLVYP